MAKRHQNPRLAKVHRCYKVDETADLYGVGKNTVRNWIRVGLQTCDNKRPIMILGSDLNAFHAKQRVKNKQPCKQNELFCMRCKSPKEPAAGMVEYQPINSKTGNLIAICPACETMMYRRISMSKIKQFSDQFGFALPLPHLHIVESHEPSVNSDFR
ncbi:MAG TPA: helix-turn-helix domain-containing protein [Methylophilaceae bacterium]|jgi:hypothetical protein